MRKLGFWSALCLCVLGIIYLVTVVIGMHSAGFSNPISGPILAIMEALTLITAPLLVTLMSAIHHSAPPKLKLNSLVALTFAVLTAGLTSAVHFVSLTALRQMGMEGIAWPSIIYAVELLAWDIFLGISLLFAASVFHGRDLSCAIRLTLCTVGILCIAGVLGPVTGDMRLQFIAVVGYGVILPPAWLMISIYFNNLDKSINPNP